MEERRRCKCHNERMVHGARGKWRCRIRWNEYQTKRRHDNRPAYLRFVANQDQKRRDERIERLSSELANHLAEEN